MPAAASLKSSSLDIPPASSSQAISLPSRNVIYNNHPLPNACCGASPSTSASTHALHKSIIDSIKNRTRGGQNLSERYKRLERSLRGKTALAQSTAHLHNVTSSNTTTHSVIFAKGSPQNVFHGFEIPKKPRPPESDECCMSGCAICVYDLYDDSLKTYKESITALQASLDKLKIPESEWPHAIQRDTQHMEATSNPHETPRSVTLSAFEELERRLEEKRQGTSDAQVPPLGAFCEVKQARDTSVLGNVKEVYEGVQWVLFSKR